MSYPRDERAKTRKIVRELNKLSDEAKQHAERGLQLDPKVAASIQRLTQTSDLSRQIDMLDGLSDRTHKAHIARLIPLGAQDFSAFCEVINPIEPPEGRWLEWLCDFIEGVEKDPDATRIILNVPPGHAKPLHVSTPVLMADGRWAALGDIKVGDIVVTDKNRARRVTHVHEQGVLPLLKLTTKAGRTVLTAGDHSFRVAGGWKQAMDLRPGDPLDIVGGLPTKGSSNVGRFEVAAAVAASGATGMQWSTTGRPHPIFRLCTPYADLLADYVKLLDAQGLDHNGGITGTQGFSVLLRPEGVRELDDTYRFTAPAKERRVPGWVFSGSDTQIAAYINMVIRVRGLTRADYQYPHFWAYFPSTAYAQDFQRLLARLGVPSSVEVKKSKANARVHLKPADVAAYKGAGLILPEGVMPVDKKKSAAASLADEVLTVEPAGEGECRCLTVDEDHTFLANGIVVHNSTYASRLNPAWIMGRNPRVKIIGASHSSRFAENEFSKKIRNIVGMPEYRAMFPGVVIDHATRAADQWAIATHGGSYVAKGAGQAIHGFRANRVFVDDPYASIHDAESPSQREGLETWFFNDVGSRLLPSAKVFLVHTRFHEYDLTGKCMEMNKALPEHSRYRVVEIPAICYDPESDILARNLGEVLWDFYDHAYFEAKRVEFSFSRFNLLYQSLIGQTSDSSVAGSLKTYKIAPHATDSALAKARDLGHLHPETGKPQVDRALYYRRVVLSVDTASKVSQRADYTVCQVWAETHDRKFFLLDQVREKVEFNDMVSLIEKTARRWSVDQILVEDKGAGTAYLQARGMTDFQRRLAPAPLVAINPGTQSKEFRFDAITPMIQEGSVYIPEDAQWIGIFLKEVGSFPDTTHDDCVDAMTQFLTWARKTAVRQGTKKIGSRG
jgi:predicted phage terminase large subunit-like protein